MDEEDGSRQAKPTESGTKSAKPSESLTKNREDESSEKKSTASSTPAKSSHEEDKKPPVHTQPIRSNVNPTPSSKPAPILAPTHPIPHVRATVHAATPIRGSTPTGHTTANPSSPKSAQQMPHGGATVHAATPVIRGREPTSRKTAIPPSRTAVASAIHLPSHSGAAGHAAAPVVRGLKPAHIPTHPKVHAASATPVRGRTPTTANPNSKRPFKDNRGTVARRY